MKKNIVVAFGDEAHACARDFLFAGSEKGIPFSRKMKNVLRSTIAFDALLCGALSGLFVTEAGYELAQNHGAKTETSSPYHPEKPVEAAAVFGLMAYGSSKLRRAMLPEPDAAS